MACRTRNFLMINFLYTNCSADFHILNNKKQNALQVLVFEGKDKGFSDVLKTFKYLIEVVGVDFSVFIESPQLISKFQEIFEYLQPKIKENQETKLICTKPEEKEFTVDFESNPSIISTYKDSQLSNFASILDKIS